jgi:hypothetical protein
MDKNNEELAPNGAGASAGARQRNPAVDAAEEMLKKYGCVAKGLASVLLTLSPPIAEKVMLAAGADVVVSRYGRAYKFFCGRGSARDRFAVWAGNNIYIIDAEKARAVARKYLELRSMRAAAEAVGLPASSIVYAAVAYLAGDVLAMAEPRRPPKRRAEGGQDDIEAVAGRR